jgi:hypothetical protein
MEEDPRSLILRQWYQSHVYSPDDIVVEMDKYLPLCFTYNNHLRMIYISINEFLGELPELIRFHGIAREKLEARIDELAGNLYGQYPNYRDQPDVVRAIEESTLMLLNVGDELFHRLHEYRLYQAGGFHHYQFERVVTPEAILLKKMPWTALVNRVSHPDDWMWREMTPFHGGYNGKGI